MADLRETPSEARRTTALRIATSVGVVLAGAVWWFGNVLGWGMGGATSDQLSGVANRVGWAVMVGGTLGLLAIWRLRLGIAAIVVVTIGLVVVAVT